MWQDWEEVLSVSPHVPILVQHAKLRRRMKHPEVEHPVRDTHKTRRGNIYSRVVSVCGLSAESIVWAGVTRPSASMVGVCTRFFVYKSLLCNRSVVHTGTRVVRIL